MADVKKEAAESSAAEPQPVTGMPKMYILGGLAVLILAQVILAYFLLPSPQDVAEQTIIAVDDATKQSIPTKYIRTDPATDAPSFEPLEKAIDSAFDISFSQGTEGTTTNYSLKFTLVVDKKKDEKKFTELFDAKKETIRADILEILREAKESEVADPRLVEIKAKITRRVDKILGAEMIRDVKLTNFSKETF